MDKRDQLVTRLFEESMSYKAAARRVQDTFGVGTSASAVCRFYRRMAEERHAPELAMAGGNVADFHRAVRKLPGVATLNACINNTLGDPGEDNSKPMVKDEEREGGRGGWRLNCNGWHRKAANFAFACLVPRISLGA